MDSKILANAKRDIPLYFQDFKAFWDATSSKYTARELTNCYASTIIFKNWKIGLNHVGLKTLDGILVEINEDVNASFFHAYFGHYRSAYMHLRSVIELSLQLIYFAQHEVEYAQWLNAEFRIKHEELTSYLKKHPKLKSKAAVNLINDITKNWIHFSKHIHAEAPAFFQTTRESVKTKIISKVDFGIWKSNHLRTSYQVNKLLLIFFSDRLTAFPTQSRDLLLRNLRVADFKEIGLKAT